MTEADITNTVNLLKQLSPGFLPYSIFEQVARLVALPIVEFIPLRSCGGQTEVLLIARPDEDPLWPGMLHTPGTVIRATDAGDAQTNWQAFERIMHDELRGVSINKPHYVGSLFHSSKRGAEQAQLYWVEVVAETKIGRFYRASDLPAELMDSQRAFILEAVRNFDQHLESFKKNT